MTAPTTAWTVNTRYMRVGDPEVIGLEQGQDERPDHADPEDHARHVLAEATDVAVAHVLGGPIAGVDDLDGDATDDRRRDRHSDRPQQDRLVVDLWQGRRARTPQNEHEIRDVADRGGGEIDPLALLFVGHAPVSDV